jgi:hypothetical protein
MSLCPPSAESSSCKPSQPLYAAAHSTLIRNHWRPARDWADLSHANGHNDSMQIMLTECSTRKLSLCPARKWKSHPLYASQVPEMLRRHARMVHSPTRPRDANDRRAGEKKIFVQQLTQLDATVKRFRVQSGSERREMASTRSACKKKRPGERVHGGSVSA